MPPEACSKPGRRSVCRSRPRAGEVPKFTESALFGEVKVGTAGLWGSGGEPSVCEVAPWAGEGAGAVGCAIPPAAAPAREFPMPFSRVSLRFGTLLFFIFRAFKVFV